jgi:cyanophycin synthetase
VRLVEIRLLDGPNVYRLEPVVKIEVAIGRRRTWYGQRVPGRHALVRLGARVSRAAWPTEITLLADWVRRLRSDAGHGRAGVAVHRSSDPGHWLVTFPWQAADRARAIADGALQLAERAVSPTRPAQLTGGQLRMLERIEAGIATADGAAPTWLRDADRRIPTVSITGTNGKSTTTRLVSHLLLRAGRHVGTTTSDGVYVDERLVDAGDWTGPGGAALVFGRHDVDVAVLETARGGILLRGVGYESNDVAIVTNVSSDHLDLQGIHTLPELAEVKATIARITRPDGWAVLNADDPFVAAVARSCRANVALFSIAPDRSAPLRRHLAAGRRAFLLRRARLWEQDGSTAREIVPVAEVPIAIGGIAHHNVANALAAAAAGRALGLSIGEVADGLRDFRPSAELAPGRLNLFRVGSRLMIVDFAHNEAGVAAVLDVAEGIAAGAAGRAAPITVIIGTAGDRPDDTLRGIGRIAARRADRVAIKETLRYLRGRTRQSVVGEIRAGVRAGRREREADGLARSGGSSARDDVPVYETETLALRSELARSNGHGAASGGPSQVLVLLCHEERDEVFGLLAELGARPVDIAAELPVLMPRLQVRPPRD